MSVLSAVGGAASGLLSGVGNVIGSVISANSAEAINEANLEYQREYNQQIFEREDTAYQRAVADAQAAGLSPLVAAGVSAGQSGGVTSAPQLSSDAAQYKGDVYKSLFGIPAQSMNALLGVRQVESQIKLNEDTGRAAIINAEANKANAEENARAGDFSRGPEFEQRIKEFESSSDLAERQFAENVRQFDQQDLRVAQELAESERYHDIEAFLQRYSIEASLTNTNKEIASREKMQRDMQQFQKFMVDFEAEAQQKNAPALARAMWDVNKVIAEDMAKINATHHGAKDYINSALQIVNSAANMLSVILGVAPTHSVQSTVTSGGSTYQSTTTSRGW